MGVWGKPAAVVAPNIPMHISPSGQNGKIYCRLWLHPTLTCILIANGIGRIDVFNIFANSPPVDCCPSPFHHDDYL